MIDFFLDKPRWIGSIHQFLKLESKYEANVFKKDANILFSRLFPQQHYTDAHRLHKKQDQKLPPPPLPPKIRLTDIPPPLPPKIQVFLNQADKDDRSFYGSSKV